jgi:putative heme-binding domain-containing protein
MWVTQSVAYPYPAKAGEEGKDAVKILVDTDADGAADQITTFADKLNIPIGVLPYGDGCLCFSIPNIWYLRDTDGDGKCDKREVVLGPFDTTRDTHGMINSLRDGGDGWIYACHGFNNQSKVAGSDGHLVSMQSGNTFRFRPDGSRIEHVTRGQVNPFGMTVDQWGYRYTADCHSKPITQLIRDACYPSFGRPHDGLGFLPPMVDHLHGSTAISGILYVDKDSPIKPLRGQMISGNVMTSRLNRNQLMFHGATAKGRELSDFLTSDDPWFRPVDIQLGSDGHIYVADFYNKIIGHYEVPLNHPGRDRTSGRIWQIRFTSAENTTSKPVLEDGDSCLLARREFIANPVQVSDSRLGELLTDDCPQVRVAAFRLAAERFGSESQQANFLDPARSAIADDNAHVVRAAAELLGLHGEQADIDLLHRRLPTVDEKDPVLRQTIRIAIRNLLRSTPSDDQIWSQTPDADLASILLGLTKPEASQPLLKYLSAHPDAENRDELLSHAAKHSSDDSLADCVRIARQITAGQPTKQFQLLDVLCKSQNARPGQVPSPLRDWALSLVDAELNAIDASEKLLVWSPTGGIHWPRESRKLRGGGEAMLVSSLGRGEKYTGKLVSDHFPAPDEIVFRLAGHNGFPKENDHGKNRIRLVLVDTGKVIQEATPPRNDVAKLVRWNTRDVQGRDVRIECIDNDSASAFAWIAFGEFQPSWIQESRSVMAMEQSLGWIKRLGLDEKAEKLESLLRQSDFSRLMKVELARTLASLRQNHGGAVVLGFLGSSDAPRADITQAVDALLDADDDALMEAAKQLCKRLSASQQRDFATAWAKQGASPENLIELANLGRISAEVFVDENVKQAIWPRLSEPQRADIESLTEGLDVDAAKAAILVSLQKSVAARMGDLDNGHRLFSKHCAACHQLRGEGAVVGPQLDGAATRSAQRLLEDVVTPDRNVDRAFRTTSFLLDDGRVVVGMVTHETDDQITAVEPNGKAIQIDPASIEARREAGRSLMPSNMDEVLSADEFGDLIRFVRER